jgi:serine/threonine protein kinase
MNQIEHFHIIRLEESFIENDALILVMEYASGGDLFQKLKSTLDYISEEVLWKFLIQLCQVGPTFLSLETKIHTNLTFTIGNRIPASTSNPSPRFKATKCFLG